MNILITGASGLLGQAVVKDLSQDKDLHLTFVNKTRSTHTNTLLLDLADRESLRRLPKNLDAIVHLSAMVPVKEPDADRNSTFEPNTLSTLNLLEFAAEAHVRRFIYGSSCSVYGIPGIEGNVAEHGEIQPPNFYALSKLAGEHLTKPYGFYYGMEIVSLRFSYLYGPCMRTNTAVCVFLDRARRGETLTVFNGGQDELDLLHVDDAAKGVRAALRLGKGAYNIGSGNVLTTLQLAKICVETTGSRSNIRTSPVTGPIRKGCMSICRAGSDLHWTPNKPLEAGLRELSAHWPFHSRSAS